MGRHWWPGIRCTILYFTMKNERVWFSISILNFNFSKYVFFRFQVLDYTQYFLDLDSANKHASGALSTALSSSTSHESMAISTSSSYQPTWQSEYNLTTYYNGLGEISREISAVSLHNLADRFTNPEDVLFSKWVGSPRFSTIFTWDFCDMLFGRARYFSSSLSQTEYKSYLEQINIT